jgi:hypothetical protein
LSFKLYTERMYCAYTDFCSFIFLYCSGLIWQIGVLNYYLWCTYCLINFIQNCVAYVCSCHLLFFFLPLPSFPNEAFSHLPLDFLQFLKIPFLTLYFSQQLNSVSPSQLLLNIWPLFLKYVNKNNAHLSLKAKTKHYKYTKSS